MAGKDSYKCRHLEDQHQSLKKTPRVETFGRKKSRKNSCVSRHSQIQKMNLYKDNFDTARRNRYSFSYVLVVCSNCM